MLIQHNGRYYRDSKEITAGKYNEILTLLRNRPTAPEGYGYRLTEDLQWELYELPHTEVEENPYSETDEIIETDMTETEEKAQAYDIIMGVNE